MTFFMFIPETGCLVLVTKSSLSCYTVRPRRGEAEDYGEAEFAKLMDAVRKEYTYIHRNPSQAGIHLRQVLR